MWARQAAVSKSRSPLRRRRRSPDPRRLKLQKWIEDARSPMHVVVDRAMLHGRTDNRAAALEALRSLKSAKQFEPGAVLVENVDRRFLNFFLTVYSCHIWL